MIFCKVCARKVLLKPVYSVPVHVALAHVDFLRQELNVLLPSKDHVFDVHSFALEILCVLICPAVRASVLSQKWFICNQNATTVNSRIEAWKRTERCHPVQWKVLDACRKRGEERRLDGACVMNDHVKVANDSGVLYLHERNHAREVNRIVRRANLNVLDAPMLPFLQCVWQTSSTYNDKDLCVSPVAAGNRIKKHIYCLLVRNERVDYQGPHLYLSSFVLSSAAKRTVDKVMEEVFAVVVGAGLSGAVMAERIASQLGKRVCVLDKRDHIGGNVYDEIHAESGIRVSRHGPHLFHTNDEEVWNYIQKFGTWRRWEHRVLSRVSDSVYVPMPVNITTVNVLCGANLASEKEMDQFMTSQREGSEDEAKTSADVAIARVGRTLYESLFKTYTRKQWGVDASKLDPSVLKRIPIRDTFDDRYFTDRFQALPTDGYTSIVASMLDHPLIEVRLKTDFFTLRHTLNPSIVIYTGPIDSYFADCNLPALEYRSIQFHTRVVGCEGYVQPAATVNFPSDSVPYTRTTEYKHFLHQPSSKSVLVSETSTEHGEPYYPMPTRRNLELYRQYQSLAEAEEATGSVLFLGRLATYKYINMDQAIRFALDGFARICQQNQKMHLSGIEPEL